MRQPKAHVGEDGTTTWRVRFRSGGRQTSRTFHEKRHADTFAGMLNSAPGESGVLAALGWLQLVESQVEAQTFGQWFDAYVDQLTGVTVRTRADYRAQKARYLEELDPMPLPLITRAHVAGVVNDLEERGLSAKTIKNVMHMLSSCLALAVEEGHIGKNPCRGIRLPRPGHDQVQARFLEEDEFARLLAEIPDYYKPLVTFLVGTGLRWSEATALRPGDVSLARGTVRVERAWKWGGPGKGWAIGPPKSRKSRRTVNAAVAALAAVHPLPARELLFVTPTGRPVRHNNFFNRVWQPAVARTGLVTSKGQPVRIHDLRHTHASWLISAGVPLEAVQDQLGHESILTTRATYGHLQPSVGVAVGRTASEILERVLVDAVQVGAVDGNPGRRLAIEGPHEAHDAQGVALRGEGDREAE